MGRHQYLISKKSTRQKAGRKWRHAQSIALQRQAERLTWALRHGRPREQQVTYKPDPRHPKPIGTIGEIVFGSQK